MTAKKPAACLHTGEIAILHERIRALEAQVKKAEAAHRFGLAGHPEGCVCRDHENLRTLRARIKELEAQNDAYRTALESHPVPCHETRRPPGGVDELGWKGGE